MNSSVGTTLNLQKEIVMLLKNKIAVIYGGGGVIGGSIARAFSREGASVNLAGRSRAKLDVVARDIASAGGQARIATLDVLDEKAVHEHADAIAAEAGRIDIALNAAGIMHVQGKPLMELSLAEFELPIHGYMRSQFIIAKAVARHMVAKRSGVILNLSTPASKVAFPGVLGFGSACGAIETFNRHLAAELGPSGVRVVCLRPDAIPETVKLGSHAREVFQPVADRAGVPLEELLAPSTSTAVLKRYPRLLEVANAAVFVASEHGGAMTGVVMNLSCGSVLD
jgi:3-oxoacyl-[acyl-carrier protein] reductase